MTLCAIPAEDPRRHILDQLEESTFGHAFRQAGPRSSGGFSPEKSRRDWSKTHDGVVSLVMRLHRYLPVRGGISGKASPAP
jgi:hypothetical protein